MKKRFIAGAVCPECQAQDTLCWWQEKGKDHLLCVSCDYQTARESEESANLPSDKTTGEVIFQTPIT